MLQKTRILRQFMYNMDEIESMELMIKKMKATKQRGLLRHDASRRLIFSAPPCLNRLQSDDRGTRKQGKQQSVQ